MSQIMHEYCILYFKAVTISHELCKNIVFTTLKKHMFWIFNRLSEATLTNIQNMFYEEIRT